MPGGNWTTAQTTDPSQRPGLYENIVAKAAALIGGGTSGVVAIPITADWGPLRVATDVFSEADLLNKFGLATGAGTGFYAVREALRGGAVKVIAFRMGAAAAAKATRILLDATAGTAITLTALYEGARANGFTIDVVTNALNGANKDVKISEGGVVLETFTGGTNAAIVAQIMGTAAGSVASKYVTAVAGGGTFVTNVAGAAMTGGNSGLAVLAGDYTVAQAALEPLVWDTFAAAGVTSAPILASIAAWIKGLRDTGEKVMLVLGSALGESQATAVTNALIYNHEGVVYVWPGVVDDAGVTRSGAEFSSRIAGLIAAKGTASGSLTHTTLSYIQKLEYLATNSEIKAALAGGVLTLSGNGAGGFQVEKGITTLTTPGTTVPTTFRKIRIVRITDSIVNAINQAANSSYIGTTLNNEVGQQLVLNAIKAYLDTLIAGGVVKPGYTVGLDPGFTSTADRMYVLIGVTPVDTVDYIFLTASIGS